MTNFNDFELAAPILQAIASEGYTEPTPIQTQAIPVVITGRDLVGIAQTGTGKTAAFALPVLHRLAANRQQAKRRGCRVLVLAPTRELAQQIGDCFRTYGRALGVTVAVVVGGVAPRPQVQALAPGVDVLVATPGRLLDHVQDRNASLETTEIFILDEADQMLDLGFIKPIRQIAAMLPARRQTLLFSATMPAEITTLADSLLRDPARVAVTPVASTCERVTQRVILVESTRKKSLLVEILSAAGTERTLVFTRTKRGADRVARHLEAAGVPASAIHGNKSQSQRQQALGGFRTGKVSTLVATDIAARGIDVDGVTHVVNYELPEIPESYVHRIGRTARAGASGTAISLCDNAERGLLRDIERLTRQTIATEDRRNDRNLSAEEKVERGGDRRDRSRHDRRDRQDHQQRRPQQGRKHDADRQSNARAARAGDDARPAAATPRRPAPQRPVEQPSRHASARPAPNSNGNGKSHHRSEGPKRNSDTRADRRQAAQSSGAALAAVPFFAPSSARPTKPAAGPNRNRGGGNAPRQRRRPASAPA